MSTRDPLQKGDFGPFAQNLAAADYFQHNQQLGVSRTLVREALRHLEAEGLVRSQGQRGPVVARPTIAETRQIYEIRGALESLAARACAESRDPHIADALDAILARMRRGYKKGSASDVLAEATSFYRLLFECAGKPVAWTQPHGQSVDWFGPNDFS